MYNSNTNVVIKERKARLQEFMQNYRVLVLIYIVTRPFLPCEGAATPDWCTYCTQGK